MPAHDGPAALVVRCVGGSGATTLTTALVRVGVLAVEREVHHGAARDVVLVTRSTAAGLHRAVLRTQALLREPAVRVHLAVVADGVGPMPLAARARLRSLRPHMASVTTVPYVARWRYVDEDTNRPLPADYERALHRIAAALDHPRDSPGAARSSGSGAQPAREDVPA
ncbi:hypothetical protein D5H78_09970 [Vallicoccus soli]|uniref:Uncharacterized protein n=1 Tax=Vallicoccus soli TaxID=2339232 RepID=A0A3A3YWD9_9ACTN|nr:hypothetical protein D5H78_09970 [Vallicoccus soli]